MKKDQYDLSHVPKGYILSKDETYAVRNRIVTEHCLPKVKKIFEERPNVQMITLFVAQYYSDDAHDEVYELTRVSEEKYDFSEVHLLHDTDGEPERYWSPKGRFTRLLSDDRELWNSMGMSVTLWSCFCEGGSQEWPEHQNFSPAVSFYRDGTFAFHEQRRPWLDGIMTDYDIIAVNCEDDENKNK